MAPPQLPLILRRDPFPALDLSLYICKMGTVIAPALLGDYSYLLHIFNKDYVPST